MNALPANFSSERFWARVQRGDGCWNWDRPGTRDGYGRIKVAGKLESPHRIAYMLTFGEIPVGQWVLHRCDNPICVRPDHLFLGDRSANMKDCASKGRLNSQLRRVG